VGLSSHLIFRSGILVHGFEVCIVEEASVPSAPTAVPTVLVAVVVVVVVVLEQFVETARTPASRLHTGTACQRFGAVGSTVVGAVVVLGFGLVGTDHG
jgi:hypothetical protein